LKASRGIGLAGQGRTEVYGWMQRTFPVRMTNTWGHNGLVRRDLAPKVQTNLAAGRQEKKAISG